jgi:hypothetical protein
MRRHQRQRHAATNDLAYSGDPTKAYSVSEPNSAVNSLCPSPTLKPQAPRKVRPSWLTPSNSTSPKRSPSQQAPPGDKQLETPPEAANGGNFDTGVPSCALREALIDAQAKLMESDEVIESV